jgi:hypothetical protein
VCKKCDKGVWQRDVSVNRRYKKRKFEYKEMWDEKMRTDKTGKMRGSEDDNGTFF